MHFFSTPATFLLLRWTSQRNQARYNYIVRDVDLGSGKDVVLTEFEPEGVHPVGKDSRRMGQFIGDAINEKIERDGPYVLEIVGKAKKSSGSSPAEYSPVRRSRSARTDTTVSSAS